MKITAFIILTLFLHVSAMTLAQNVTLSEHKAPLEKVINEIKQQTGYFFLYNEDWLKQAQPVEVDVKNSTLEKALELCFANQPFSYAIVNKTIVLKLKAKPVEKKETAVPVTITGRVTDSVGTPLISATVSNRTSNKSTITDDKGEFSIDGQAGDQITITFIGFNSYSFIITNNTSFQTIVLHTSSSKLSEVVVVNTGYQTLPKERATGSFVQLDNTMINRAAGTNILDRLQGITLGLYGTTSGGYQPNPSQNSSYNIPGAATDPASRKLNLTIRGVSTLSGKVGTDPLIVLDNFPYDGDLNNINPNDIESVTVLKDAAAASIWGARAGNGVIVLTTKRGRYNHQMEVEFHSNVTVTNKPNIFNSPFYLDASDYIDVETILFNKGFYNSSINNKTSYPYLSPVVDILAAQKAGQLSATDATAQINALRNNDIRNDISNYLYQKTVNTQNSIGIRGGTDKLAYQLSVGYDNNASSQVGDGLKRTTINTNNTYKPIKNLEITTSLNYSKIEIVQNGNVTPFKSPYNTLMDNNGNPLPIYGAFRKSYTDSLQKLGFQNWQYSPLQELQNSDNTTGTNDLLLRIGARYKIITGLSAEVNYENETQHINGNNYQNLQTFAVRSLVNQFTQYTPATQSFIYKVPLGGILNINNTDNNSNSYRVQFNFDKNFNATNEFSAIAGSEIREINTEGYSRTSYGYDNNLGTSNNALDYADALPKTPSGNGLIPSPDGTVRGVTLRYISYFANAAYTYQNRYTFSLSGRKDGSNIFGVNANDRVTPLWSTGFAWDISRENFYHLEFIPYLKLRATYGFNGNIYNGTAYVTGQYLTSGQTGAQYISQITPPNPDLSWERVKNLNIGLDFSLKRNILSGTIEIYRKEGLGLIEPVSIAASTGFTSFSGNAASTRTNGLEISLTSKNFDRQFKWYTTILLNGLHDQITKYDVPQTSTSIQSSLEGQVGRPIASVYSYKWAGLDPTNGDPRGYLNGTVSKNYAGIINNYNPDSLTFNGSARPTIFGSLRNDFSYKGFTLSVNIRYELGYYFRRTSTSLNYQDITAGLLYQDYSQRWQNPGDEQFTNVPSLVYPSNSNREKFYQYSSALVSKGDNIRIQDIRLAYDINKLIRRSPFKSLQVYSYANNLGIIWRANKYGIDPETYGGFGLYPTPLSIAFGVSATF